MTLRLTGLLAFAIACAPPANTYDAGCYPAPLSYPVADAGGYIGNGCSWTSGCGSVDGGGSAADLLTQQFHDVFQANANCTMASDCALYANADGGSSYLFQCYTTTYTQPINASQRGVLDQCLEAIITSFCSQCYPNGGLVQGDVAPPTTGDAGSCTEVFCGSGVCGETLQ